MTQEAQGHQAQPATERSGFVRLEGAVLYLRLRPEMMRRQVPTQAAAVDPHDPRLRGLVGLGRDETEERHLQGS